MMSSPLVSNQLPETSNSDLDHMPHTTEGSSIQETAPRGPRQRRTITHITANSGSVSINTHGRSKDAVRAPRQHGRAAAIASTDHEAGHPQATVGAPPADSMPGTAPGQHELFDHPAGIINHRPNGPAVQDSVQDRQSGHGDGSLPPPPKRRHPRATADPTASAAREADFRASFK